MAASANGYAAPIWMTFKQARDLGAAVRRGEHGTPSSTPTPSPAPRPTKNRRGDGITESPS